MTNPERETPNREAQRLADKRFLGMLLMSAGGLLTALCGLCTLAFGITFIAEAVRFDEIGQLTSLLLPLIIGGVPTAAGVTLFCVGLSMYRDGRKRRGHPEREFD